MVSDSIPKTLKNSYILCDATNTVHHCSSNLKNSVSIFLNVCNLLGLSGCNDILYAVGGTVEPQSEKCVQLHPTCILMRKKGPCHVMNIHFMYEQLTVQLGVLEMHNC